MIGLIIFALVIGLYAGIRDYQHSARELAWKEEAAERRAEVMFLRQYSQARGLEAVRAQMEAGKLSRIIHRQRLAIKALNAQIAKEGKGRG